MNINFVVVVVVISFQRVTFTFQLHVNPRMFQIKKKKIKKCHQKLHGDQKKNKKEQKKQKQ